jgi:hypothetical protein
MLGRLLIKYKFVLSPVFSNLTYELPFEHPIKAEPYCVIWDPRLILHAYKFYKEVSLDDRILLSYELRSKDYFTFVMLYFI